MNLLRVLAFNGQNISSDAFASYLHFLLEPNEHNLEYQFLHNFLELINQKLNNDAQIQETLHELDSYAKTRGINTIHNVDTLSRVTLENVTIDLIIKCPKVTILVDIKTSKTKSSEFIEGYLNFIDNNPFDSNNRLICCTIDSQESINKESWNEVLRSMDCHIYIPFQHPDPAIPSLNKAIFNLFRIHGLIPGKSLSKEITDSYPGFKLLNDLWDFIDNNFQGYGFVDDVSKIRGVLLLNSVELESKIHGFIHFRNGISGLMRLHKEQILTYQFPYIANRPNSHGWIEVSRVQSYLKWFLSSKSLRQNRGDLSGSYRNPNSGKLRS